MFLKNPVGLNVLKKGPPKKTLHQDFCFLQLCKCGRNIGYCKSVLSQFPFPDARLLWLIDPTTYGLYKQRYISECFAATKVQYNKTLFFLLYAMYYKITYF